MIRNSTISLLFFLACCASFRAAKVLALDSWRRERRESSRMRRAVMVQRRKRREKERGMDRGRTKREGGHNKGRGKSVRRRNGVERKQDYVSRSDGIMELEWQGR